MTTLFPGALDTFPDNKTIDLEDGLKAVQAKVGITGSADTASHDFKLARIKVGANAHVALGAGTVDQPLMQALGSSTPTNTTLNVRETFTGNFNTSQRAGVVNECYFNPTQHGYPSGAGYTPSWAQVNSAIVPAECAFDLYEVNGGYFQARHYGSGKIGYLAGVEGRAWIQGTGGAEKVYAVWANVISNGAGVMDEAAGVFVGRADIYSTGTITNSYGVQIKDQSGTGTARAENIRSEGTNSKNVFEGTVTARSTLVSGHSAMGTGTVDEQILTDPTATQTLLNNRETYTGNLNTGQRAMLVNILTVNPTQHAYPSGAGYQPSWTQLNFAVTAAECAFDVYELNAGFFGARHYGSGKVGYLAGLEGRAFLVGAGGAEKAYGVWSAIIHVGSGVADLAAGVRIDPPGIWGTGTVTNSYGVHIGDHAGSGTARAENIRSEGATSVNVFEGRGGFGSTAAPVASAQLEVASTTRGFLPPRMTTAQRDAITSPAAGLTIYNTETGALNVFTTVWGAVGGGGGTPGGADTQVQFNDGGAFGGDSGMVFDKTTDQLTVAGSIVSNRAGGNFKAITGNTAGARYFTGNNYDADRFYIEGHASDANTTVFSGANPSYIFMVNSLGLGAAAHATALLDLTSTTKGFLPPRMTTAQRDAISSPPAGLVIYNTDTDQLEVMV